MEYRTITLIVCLFGFTIAAFCGVFRQIDKINQTIETKCSQVGLNKELTNNSNEPSIHIKQKSKDKD